MKEIPLSRGLVALVDDEDYEKLSQYKWHAKLSCGIFYAARSVKKEDGKRTTVYMHHDLIGKKKGFHVDHCDGNSLNNQRYNLSHVTPRQNAQNRHTPRSSELPGVAWNKRSRKWQAQIGVNGKTKHLGYYTDEYDAYLAYRKAVKEHEGEDSYIIIGY